MAAGEGGGAARSPGRRAGARPSRALSAALLSAGMLLTGLGVMLSGLCLLAGGIICEGTAQGDIGHLMVVLGVPVLVAAAWAVRRGGGARAHQAEGGPLALGLAPASGKPVASNCPECGAPVPRGASVCAYCGETFG